MFRSVSDLPSGITEKDLESISDELSFLSNEFKKLNSKLEKLK